MIRIHFSAYFFTALLLLILPLDWFAAMAAASAVHEISHILMVYALGGSIRQIRIGAGGCVIDSGTTEDWRQFFSILAGPLGSFSLLLLCRAAPKTAICGLLQGICNLIPVLPLDGGRLLRLLLYRLCPSVAKTCLEVLEIGICILLNGLGIWLYFRTAAGPWPALLTMVWTKRVLSGKIPCKPSQIGVQ